MEGGEQIEQTFTSRRSSSIRVYMEKRSLFFLLYIFVSVLLIYYQVRAGLRARDKSWTDFSSPLLLPSRCIRRVHSWIMHTIHPSTGAQLLLIFPFTSRKLGVCCVWDDVVNKSVEQEIFRDGGNKKVSLKLSREFCFF